MQYVNDQFFELTGHSHAHVDKFAWFNLIADEDLGLVQKDWENMLQCRRSDGVQFRLKKTWVNQDGIRSNIWVQSSGFPQVNEHGKVISKTTALLYFIQAKILKV
jgi:PAS domain S-box-containing protein